MMDDFDDLLNDLEGNIKNMESVDETLQVEPSHVEDLDVVEIDPDGIEIGVIEIQEDLQGDSSVSLTKSYDSPPKHRDSHDDHHNNRQPIHMDGSHDHHDKHRSDEHSRNSHGFGGHDHDHHHDHDQHHDHGHGLSHGHQHVDVSHGRSTHDHGHKGHNVSGYHASAPVDEESYRFVMNGEGIHGGKIGSLCQFTIDILDQHTGKPAALRSGEVVVEISGPERLNPIVADQSTGNVGRFVVQYQPKRAGIYHINILWDGQSVLSGPQAVSISDHASASFSAVVSRPNKVHLHQKSTFQLKACDRSGSQLKWGGDSFQVRVKGPDTPRDLRLLDHNNGLYTVEFVIVTSGKYTFMIELDGQHIQGSPMDVLA